MRLFSFLSVVLIVFFALHGTECGDDDKSTPNPHLSLLTEQKFAELVVSMTKLADNMQRSDSNPRISAHRSSYQLIKETATGSNLLNVVFQDKDGFSKPTSYRVTDLTTWADVYQETKFTGTIAYEGMACVKDNTPSPALFASVGGQVELRKVAKCQDAPTHSAHADYIVVAGRYVGGTLNTNVLAVASGTSLGSIIRKAFGIDSKNMLRAKAFSARSPPMAYDPSTSIAEVARKEGIKVLSVYATDDLWETIAMA
jgi:hypothetical protein